MDGKTEKPFSGHLQGNVLVQYPGLFAAAALVNGVPDDYSGGDDFSCHWLVPDADLEYNVKNRDIPVHLWMFQKEGNRPVRETDYFTDCYGEYLESGIDVWGQKGEMRVSKTNPAWLFTSKNGWDKLADETGEFILVSPDSPGNIWFLHRDGMVFPQIVYDMEMEFGIDVSRVYLTGFSNGGMMVREIAVQYPHLFAGVSSWNAPSGNTAAMMREDALRFYIRR